MKKLLITAGTMNLVISGLLGLQTLFFIVVAAACLLMTFSLFFLAAIPAAVIIGGIAFILSIAAIANLITGIGALVGSCRTGKFSKAISIVSIVINALMIPLCVFSLLFGIELLRMSFDWFSFVLALFGAIMIVFTIASLVIHIVCLKKLSNPAITSI